jgi:HTH-type transcriptional regulator/antitoxin HipB
MKYTPDGIGKMVRTSRKRLGLTQEELALAAGTGPRFVVDLEHGKPTCELGKTLLILNNLGIRMSLQMPLSSGDGDGTGQG